MIRSLDKGRLRFLRVWRLNPLRALGETAAAMALLVVFSPLMLVVAVAIRLESKGPIVFRQTRVGLRQEPFEMLKFRSMKVGSERQHRQLLEQQLTAGGSFLLHEPLDPRTTRVGRIIRKLSIDELPQLINVIRGDMSLVGPRPMLPEEIEHLSDEQLRRFDVLPGVTGLAQVNGRSALGHSQYVEYDLHFVDSYSRKQYWSVILSTPFAVISGRGAT